MLDFIKVFIFFGCIAFGGFKLVSIINELRSPAPVAQLPCTDY